MSGSKVSGAAVDIPQSYLQRPSVPGLGGLRARMVRPKPYPINIYFRDNDDTSGIAGTLYPDGTFKSLVPEPVPRETTYWDERLARKVPGTVVWNGVVAGSVQLASSSEEPHKRVVDPNSFLEWPNNPPRPVRPGDARRIPEHGATRDWQKAA